ncbi:hypothetical protein QUF64_04495 [Anaerolineales bacterium HSG6]|nr:hypothetical protein [Anaerolineales bacterium HSG6]
MKDPQTPPSEDTQPTSEQRLTNIEQALLASNKQADERSNRMAMVMVSAILGIQAKHKT